MHFWLPQILHSSTKFHTITEHPRTCLTPDSALHNLYLSETLRIAPWGHKVHQEHVSECSEGTTARIHSVLFAK